jgi:lantibiotic biosynthesis protein
MHTAHSITAKELPAEEVVLLRVAALSVTEGMSLAWGTHPDKAGLIRAGIELAASGELLTLAGAKDRALTAIRKYVVRMSSRATPFGLFAGVCPVPVGRETRLVNRGRQHYTAAAWIDTETLRQALAELTAQYNGNRMPLRLNPTLRLAGGVYRYQRPGTGRSDVAEVRATPAIACVVAACGCGSMTPAEITARLDPAGTASEDPAGLVPMLTERGLLVADSGLVTAGADPSDTAAAFLRRCGLDREAAAISTACETLKRQHPVTNGYARSLDRTWRTLSREIPAFGPVESRYRYHVEMQTRVDGTIGRPVLRALGRAVSRLEEIFPPADLSHDFLQDFQNRYGDATVPLLAAADPERGVLNRGTRPLSKLAAQVRLGRPAAEPGAPVNAVQSAALDHWLRTGTAYDLGAPRKGHPESDTTGIIAALIGSGGRPMTAVLQGASARSPGVFLARFSVDRPELAGPLRHQMRVTSAARAGQDDAISAEVLYNPGGRIGNVLVRPLLSDETIALDGATGGTLALDRLLLRVEGERLAVYDAVTGRPVVLFLSSAYSTGKQHIDPLYRLLASICQCPTRPWTWGGLNNLSRLPRVCCGEVIVSPQTWRAEGAAVSEAANAGDPVGELRSLLPGLGDRRWVGFGASQQKLAIDTTRAEAITQLLRRCRQHTAIEFSELPHVEHPAVSGPRGGHVAEISIGRAAGRRRMRNTAPQCEPQSRQDWIYCQYFCGATSARRVISMVAALAHQLREDGAADLWFFVRYAEGGSHIRARIKAIAGAGRPTVLAAMDRLGMAMLEESVITSFRMEPYLPEVRRYGGPAGMLAAERLFSADSDDVAARVAGDPSERDRLIMGACDVYAWWSTAMNRPDPPVATLREAQRSAALGGAPDRKIVGKITRDHRSRIDHEFKPSLKPGTEETLTALVSVVKNSWGTSRLGSIVRSVVHMHCNRLFTFEPRRMEYLAYEFAIQKALQMHTLRADQR